MCGISGYMDIAKGVDVDALRSMNEMIRHRGPDDEGYAFFSRGEGDFIACFSSADSVDDVKKKLAPLESISPDNDYFLGFGHRRLSILDVSEAGHQPMYDEKHGCCIVYNGEVYNFREIRVELEALGYEFKTSSDTEVVLASYANWGEDCVNRFNGMWAFAIWDASNHRLFCSRDRLGAKPFVYHRTESSFVFGSEIKQLCKVPDIPRVFDLEYVASVAVYKKSDYNDATLIRDIRVLPPAHNAVLQLSEGNDRVVSFEIDRYWNLEDQPELDLSEDECVEAFQNEFERSCSWRMRSDVPVAALLSGGLDSSCLVTQATASQRKFDPDYRMTTYSASYPGNTMCDETDFAKRVCSWNDCKANFVTPDPGKNLFAEFKKLVWAAEGFCAIQNIGGRMMFERISEQGFKVVLNGQCADESWFGYERYYAYYFKELLKHGHGIRFIKEFKSAAKHTRLTVRDLIAWTAYFGFPFVRNGRQLKRARRYCSHLVTENLNYESLKDVLYPKTMRDLVINELTKGNLPNIVRLDDRMYMSASLESRIPFMDYRLVELAVAVPSSMKIQHGWTKYVIRKAFDEKLPNEVVWRTSKMGFPAPEREWFKQADCASFEKLFDSPRTEPLFNIDEIHELYKKNPVHSVVQVFFIIELFARMFDVTVEE